MPDDTDDFDDFASFMDGGNDNDRDRERGAHRGSHAAGGDRLDDAAEAGAEGIEEEPTSYHSGRVRIIGAEPAGDTVREVTGPVVDEHPEIPHWNDAPTGQVPAILDSTNGEESAVAPPMWREEENDWEAQEEVFEPSMLSDDLPAVGALLGEQHDDLDDVERRPWHFESDDTLVIPPEPGFGAEPGFDEPGGSGGSGGFGTDSPLEPEPILVEETVYEADFEPVEVPDRTAVPVNAAASAAASRLSPPQAPEPKTRAARTSRSNGNVRTGNVNTAGTAGRDMRVAIGSGVLLGAIGLACFAAGTVASMVIVCVVVLLATAEAYAAFRRAQYHPATLLGLVAVLSLLIETYNKGVAALPLVLVLLVAGSFVWYLARVEPAAEPVSGISSTVFVFVWVGAFGSFAALLLESQPVPRPPRHRLRPGRRHRHGGRRRGLALNRRGHGTPSARSLRQPQQELGGADRRCRRRHPRVGHRRPLHPSVDVEQGRALRRGGGDRRPARRPEPVDDQAPPGTQGHGKAAARPRRHPGPGRRTALRHARHVLRGQGVAPRVS